MQHRGAQYSWVARHMSEQLMIFPPLLVPSSSTLMKEHRQIQWPNLWCQRCIALGCRGSSDDRNGLESQIMLQDWRDIDTWELYWQFWFWKWRYSPERPYWLLASIKVLLSILKPLALGNIGIVAERQIGIEAESWSDSNIRSSSSQFLYAQSCSAIYDKSLAWQFIDWSTFFIHGQISSNHKISGTENIMRKQRAWRDCHPVFFVWKCCEWCVWPRATDDNILLNCSPQHFLSQQSKEE